MTTWLPVVGFEGYYEVSDDGRVRSLDRVLEGRDGRPPRRWRGREMKPSIGQTGYPRVPLKRHGVRYNRMVHRLVLEAFVGPCPDGMEGCHNDGNPGNNSLSNLRWDTKAANAQDRLRHGRDAHASLTHCPRGHKYSDENTYRNQRGDRQCRACDRAIYAEKNPGAKRFGPYNLSKTHCRNGHPRNEVNSYVNKRGRRVCRVCHRDTQRELKRRQKAVKNG